ncbi:MAG: hypothetical protein ACREK5_09560 [Gemmatimonadota bacterium]
MTGTGDTQPTCTEPGGSLLLATLAALAQTAGGRAPLEPSLALAALVLTLGAWALVAVPLLAGR